MNYLTVEQTQDSLNVTFQTRSISDPLAVKAALAELVQKARFSGQTRVVLDFSRLQLISTGMLGALLKFRSHTLFHGATLILTGLNAELEQVFSQTGLEGLFEIEPDGSTGSSVQPREESTSAQRMTLCIA